MPTSSHDWATNRSFHEINGCKRDLKLMASGPNKANNAATHATTATTLALEEKKHWQRKLKQPCSSSTGDAAQETTDVDEMQECTAKQLAKSDKLVGIGIKCNKDRNKIFHTWGNFDVRIKIDFMKSVNGPFCWQSPHADFSNEQLGGKHCNGSIIQAGVPPLDPQDSRGRRCLYQPV